MFNLNAPVPPANEAEALTQTSQYQNSYSQQGFSNQSQQLPVEQTEMQTDQLQSGELAGLEQIFPLVILESKTKSSCTTLAWLCIYHSATGAVLKRAM